MKTILCSGLALLGAAAILVFPSACKKKNAVPVVADTATHPWRPIPMFNGTGAVTTVNRGDSELLVGTDGGYYVLSVKDTNFRAVANFPLPDVTLLNPVKGTAYFDGVAATYSTASSLYVWGLAQHDAQSLLKYTPTFEYPPVYSIFNDFTIPPQGSYPGYTYPMVRDRYVLVPVEFLNESNQQMRFDLVRFDSASLLGTNGAGDVPHVTPVIATAGPGTVGFINNYYYCAVFDDKFFVNCGSQFMRIDTAGNIKVFGYTPTPYSNNPGIIDMFTYGGMLFADASGIIFSSADEGETWNIFQSYFGTPTSSVIYRNLHGSLYGSFPDLNVDLWDIKIPGNIFDFSQINNAGLQGGQLTSMAIAGPYAFITTTTGVYYRDTAYLNQLTIPVRENL
jgi:hypothetical protein